MKLCNINESIEYDILKSRNRLIEAIWIVVVGDDTPTSEDGQLLVQNHVHTKDGFGNTYNFVYKGEIEVTLVEVNNLRNYSYFLYSERNIITKVMENVIQLAKQKG